MLLSDLGIKKPVTACVINLLLMLVGVLAIQKLPLREYPSISFPVVMVKSLYPGASASVIGVQVTKVIEDQLSGIKGISSIKSTSGDGKSVIVIKFKPDSNIEVAANDVRDAVSRVEKKLPRGVEPPTVEKSDPDDYGVITFSISDKSMPLVELTDYINRKLIDPLTLISGVSSVELHGDHDYALLVRLNPAAMASHNITINDVKQAISRENIEAPAGIISNSEKNYTIKLVRSYATVQDYKQLVVGRNNDGSLLYLSDIATIKRGAKSGEKLFEVNGQPAIGLEFLKQSQANTLNVVQHIKTAIRQIEPFLPKGMSIKPLSDSAIYIKQAINEVYSTLTITILLVIIVIRLFLGSFRAALLPAISIPVSLLAAFAALQWFGYSINLITLLALVLATGLLVDDAIVVVENIHTHIALGEPPILAAYRGTREVGMAIIATTAVLVVIFIPIAFLSGTIGLLFREYGVAMAASIIASSVVALTMGPVIGSHILKSHKKPDSLSVWVEYQLKRLEKIYRVVLHKSFAFKSFPIVIILMSIIAITVMFYQLPKAFSPQEDQGRLYVNLTAQEGTSYQAMVTLVPKVESLMQPLMRADGPVKTVALITPVSGDESNMIMMVDLKSWEKRKVSVFEVANQIHKLLSVITELKVQPRLPSGFSSGMDAPVQLVISGGSYPEVKKWVDLLQKKASKNPNLLDMETDYNEKKPEILMKVKSLRASELGISVQDIASALNTLLSGEDLTTFIDHGKEYDVNIQAPTHDFKSINDLGKIYLRSAKGKLISLASLVDVAIEGQPNVLRHYNRRKSITLSANLAPGYSLGDALHYLQQLVIKDLPSQANLDYKGDSLTFIRSSGSMNTLFILAVLIVYLLLAAQFESFIHPLIIIISIFPALLGAFAGMLICGLTLNIYTQLALIMLVGLATKNSILIVEFINQLRNRNFEFDQAVLEGAVLRMRPIIMTVITTLVGTIPLIIASGAGSESRSMIGIVIFSGLLVSTIITLLVIPGCYRLIARNTEASSSASTKLKNALKLFPEKV